MLTKLRHTSLAPILLLAACTLPTSKAAFMDNGLQKAAFDMHCEPSKLEVTQLASGSMGVRGCGKQGRYEYVMGGPGWVLNASDEGAK